MKLHAYWEAIWRIVYTMTTFNFLSLLPALMIMKTSLVVYRLQKRAVYRLQKIVVLIKLRKVNKSG